MRAGSEFKMISNSQPSQSSFKKSHLLDFEALEKRRQTDNADGFLLTGTAVARERKRDRIAADVQRSLAIGPSTSQIERHDVFRLRRVGAEQGGI